MNILTYKATLNLPALLVAGLLLHHSSHAATVITNEGFTLNNQSLPGSSTYASNVTTTGANWLATTGNWGVMGTPDLALTWSGTGGNSGIGFDTFASFTTHGKVIQLDGAGGGTQPQYQIIFTPSAGAGVYLSSFDLISGNTQTKSVSWSVTGALSGTIASGTWTGNADIRDTINANASGQLGETVTLTLIGTTGPTTFLGFDNLAIDQITAVPEPHALALGALACGVFLLRRRRG